MWRKTPPTLEDVKQYSYWWNKSSIDEDTMPCILCLDVCDEKIFETERGDGLIELNPNDWGEWWAPCIPPRNY